MVIRMGARGIRITIASTLVAMLVGCLAITFGTEPTFIWTLRAALAGAAMAIIGIVLIVVAGFFTRSK